MKNLLTILALLILNLTALGQHHLGLKVNGGISRMSNSSNPSNSTNTVHLAPSGNGGLFYNYELGGKSILGADLLFTQIGGIEKIEFDLTSNGDIIGNTAGTMYKHISYLSLPIFYGIKLNDLTINIGFQFSYAITSSGRQKGEATINGERKTFDTKFDKLNIDPFDFGPRAGLAYSITDNFAIEGTYYYGINNIIAKDGPSWTWRIQQATIGIKYAFLNSTNNKK